MNKPNKVININIDLQKGNLQNKVLESNSLDCSKILEDLKRLKFIPKRLFLKYNKCFAKLVKVFNLNNMTIWVYILNNNYKFHHFNIGVTIHKTLCKKAVCRTKLKRKIKKFFIPFLAKNKRLFIWIKLKKSLN